MGVTVAAGGGNVELVGFELFADWLFLLEGGFASRKRQKGTVASLVSV